MSKVNKGWVVAEPKTPVLTYLYSFGPGLAHALAVKGADGMIVVSPPCKVPDEAFTELEKYGPVQALVASNAFHHMGLPIWKKRFPNARVFAPAQAVARVQKHSKIGNIQPLAEAAGLAGPNVELIDMPHYKTGEVLVRVRTDAGYVWYVTDVIMNMPSPPKNFPFNLLFKWSGSAPGLKFNGIAPLFMVKDKKALRAWLHEEAKKAPPTTLITCHGNPVTMQPPGKQLLELFGH